MAAPGNQMSAIELARRLAELGDAETAIKIYEAALKEDGTAPMDRMEAACAVLQYSENYKAAYDTFLALYREEAELRGNIFGILTEAFYVPNVKKQEKRYKKNCKLLKSYPYIFRKDFLPFEELPVQFYPYDDDGVLPFYKDEERFDTYTDINEPRIKHYFFRDLEKPIFAQDIFSQYELEYLKDNVRRSDWIARENHIYLHYSDWSTFCSWLTQLDLKPLLEDEKFVFLIEDEKSLYPIDFKERFGIDYSQCPTKPLHIQEVTRLIWHTQLGTHNGGDFFNEILHDHPNIIYDDSLMFYDMQEAAEIFCYNAEKIIASKGALTWSPDIREQFDAPVLHQISNLKTASKKDAWVAFFMGSKGRYKRFYHEHARIVPPLLIQPHFHYSETDWSQHPSGRIAISNKNYRKLMNFGIFEQFKYIKTFIPLRRPTISHTSTMSFMKHISKPPEFYEKVAEMEKRPVFPTISDNVLITITNRNMMGAEHDRVYKDSCVVRFEDAKLNPTATFTALAEFLDIPYTESMTYCSNDNGKMVGGIGFSTAAVYRTNDEYCDNYERKLIEYLLKDVYQAYGYDFMYHDGKEMTFEEVKALLEKCKTNFDYLIESNWNVKSLIGKHYEVPPEKLDDYMKERINYILEVNKDFRRLVAEMLSYTNEFCNTDGDPLHLVPLLNPVPELLEQPLYH